MGLYVESLENIPAEARRDYYIYLLDYGWDEPIGNALVKNYEKMASLAASSRAVVIRGTNRVHFEDEVLSWHDINGEDATELLPAILITNRNPHKFKETFDPSQAEAVEKHLRMILIPLRKFCSNATEVVALIEKLFADIRDQKALADFKIAKRFAKNNNSSKADMVTLEPDSAGSIIPMDNVVNYLGSGKPNSLTVERTVLPIHFEDRSGNEFERLVFAYLSRERKWDTLEWLGQSGGDNGRDIWGTLDGESYCYQCANYRSLVLKKISLDIDKLVAAGFVPDHFAVVCGGRVGANLRTAIANYASALGIQNTVIWSGVEFEERLRRDTPELVKRFVEGEVFPELSVPDQYASDQKVIEELVECFDRPAFTTPFHNEVNIPDFGKAITDTIEVLNTGVHRLRDGTAVRTISSRHQISDSVLKSALKEIYQLTLKLRNNFVALQRNGEIKPCGCDQDNCPVWMLTDNACKQLDEDRKSIFKVFHRINHGHGLELK